MGANSTFSPLFFLQVEHNFFSDNLCRTLAFRPTPETEVAIEKLGLLTRNTPGSVRVFYDESRHSALLSQASNPAGPLRLEFLAYSRDPLFGDYTEPPPQKEGSVLSFSNQNGVADAQGGTRLHQQEFVGEADFAELVAPWLWGGLGRRHGQYRPLLAVSIGISEAAVSALNGLPAASTKTYYIKFQAGQTLWRYYLLGELAREGFYVNDREEQIEFVPEGEMLLVDQRVALTYRSKTLLPFRQRSNYHFQLRDRNSGGGRVLIRRLPVASPGQINREVIDGENTPVSEMYINR